MNIDMFYCQNKLTKKCLEEDYLHKLNGDLLEYSKVEDGCIMKYINPNLLFYFLEDL